MKIKIIQSNRFKEHMKVHEDEFLYDIYRLISYATPLLNEKLKADFEVSTIVYPQNVGYENLVSTSNEDKIIYAKRKNRDIYSKFVLNRNAELTNKYTMILKKSFNKNNEYYLITMFAGNKPEKELQDNNIKDAVEFKKCLDFWDKHALVFNENIIQENSIINELKIKTSDLPWVRKL